jgi:aminopeptidase N
MNQLYRTFVFLLLGLTFLACESNDSKLTQDGVPFELAKYRVAVIKNLRYDLHLVIPKEQKAAIQGQETIYFDIHELSEPLILDFKVPEEFLTKLITNGNEAAYRFEDEHIIIDKQYLHDGENIIELTFRAGETSLNRNPEFLYTLFVPDRARTAFPCFDQPNLKGKYSLTLTIPEEWQAIANGAKIDEIKEGKQKTLKFAETKPLSTYLFDFVAGDFKVVAREVGGRKMTMLHRETDSVKLARNIDEIFNLHLKSLDWLEDYTGIEYPFQKFGFAIIPSFQYGGMEHPGAITYKASSLFLDESATQNKLMGRASLIAHETAHMWFGDMVTMDWFDDVWMKEVFANFMAAKIVNPSFPEINHDLRFLLAHYPSAYAIDRSKGTHPIQQPLDNLKDAGTLYGSIIYQKAPIVMRKLERKIGEDVMQKGLHDYLSDFAYSNASWDDLISILDSVSEEGVTAWSNQWIKTAGMPQIFPYIRTENDDSTIKRLSVHQRNFDDDKSWSQRLAVDLEAQDTMYHFEVDMESNGFNEGITIKEGKGLKGATFMVCNAKGYGYGYFRMGPLTKKRWMEKMQDFEDPVLRGVGWLNLWEGFLRQQVNTQDLLTAILKNLQAEPDPLIQQYLLGRLSTIYWKFLARDSIADKAKEIEDILWQRIAELDDNKLKSAYLSTYRSLAVTDEAVGNLHKLWSKELVIDGIKLSESDYTQLAYQLALREWKDYEKILDEQIARIDNFDRKARIEFIRPSLSSNQEIRDTFFESLKEVTNREHESWVQEAIGFLHHPLRAEDSRKYITPTLELLEEIQQTGDIFFPKRVLDNTFRGHQSVEVVDDVRQFLYRNNHYPENLKNKILQASDLTFRAAEMLAPEEETKVVL